MTHMIHPDSHVDRASPFCLFLQETTLSNNSLCEATRALAQGYNLPETSYLTNVEGLQLTQDQMVIES